MDLSLQPEQFPEDVHQSFIRLKEIYRFESHGRRGKSVGFRLAVFTTDIDVIKCCGIKSTGKLKASVPVARQKKTLAEICILFFLSDRVKTSSAFVRLSPISANFNYVFHFRGVYPNLSCSADINRTCGKRDVGGRPSRSV